MNYKWLREQTELILSEPSDTAQVRAKAGLEKIGEKGAHVFESQAVDGLALCLLGIGTKDTSVIGFSVWCKPDIPRRQLHRLEPKQGGIRPPYGGSVASGFKKNTVVEYRGKLHRTGGTTKGRLSLHSHDYKNRRVTRNPNNARSCLFRRGFWSKLFKKGAKAIPSPLT